MTSLRPAQHIMGVVHNQYPGWDVLSTLLTPSPAEKALALSAGTITQALSTPRRGLSWKGKGAPSLSNFKDISSCMQMG